MGPFKRRLQAKAGRYIAVLSRRSVYVFPLCTDVEPGCQRSQGVGGSPRRITRHHRGARFP